MALDPESRLVVSLVVGKRTDEATHALVKDFRRRTAGRVMRLMTSDEYPAYPDAIQAVYGTTVTPPRTGRPGRPRKAYTVVPPEVTYATVHKTREGGRVVDVSTRVVFGTAVAVALALAVSVVSRVVNTCFVERHNGTDRNRSSRKVRKGYGFSKGWGGAPGGHAVQLLQLQLLRAGADAPGEGRGRPVAPTDPGDGGRISRPRVDDGGMAGLPRRTTKVGHHQTIPGG